MKITTSLALPIVSQLMSSLDFNVNIMDDQGIIVASGEPGRIGQVHEGATQVLTSKRYVAISELDKEAFMGAKPGVNLPIEFQNQVVGVVGITGRPDEVYRFGTLVKMNVEVLIQQIYMNQQLQYRKMALESWMNDLINPQNFSEKKLEVTAKSLDIDCTLLRCVVLAEIEELKWREDVSQSAQLQQLNERKEQLLGELKSLLDYRTVLAYADEGLLLAIMPVPPTGGNERLDKLSACLNKHGYRFRIGTGGTRGGLHGYRDSYKQALQCLRLMRRFGRERQASRIEDWGVVPYLEAIPAETRQILLDKYLPAHKTLNEDFKETLQVFMDCDLDVKQASSLLHIHRNTLFYRLDRISQQLGLDYRKFNDMVALKLLLTFDRLRK